MTSTREIKTPALCADKPLSAEPRRSAALEMDRSADLAQGAVQAEIARYINTLASVAAGLGSHKELEAGEFAEATRPLVGMNFAGASSMVYVVPARDQEIADTQKTWRDLGATDLTLKPSGSGIEHLFTIINTPLDEAAPTPTGVDVSQAAAPVAALAESRRTGQVTISDT